MGLRPTEGDENRIDDRLGCLGGKAEAHFALDMLRPSLSMTRQARFGPMNVRFFSRRERQ